MNDIQLRGHCSCCGRVQAVIGGTMSKHGYTVEHGWFQGVCPGQHDKPIEVCRIRADQTVAYVRNMAAGLRQEAELLTSGERVPVGYRTGRSQRNAQGKWEAEIIPWADANEWQRKWAVEAAVQKATWRAQSLESQATQFAALIDRVHGQPLLEVKRAEKPAPILIGEVRGGLTVTSVQGARVYWKDARGFKGWTGTQAFRKIAK